MRNDDSELVGAVIKFLAKFIPLVVAGILGLRGCLGQYAVDKVDIDESGAAVEESSGVSKARLDKGRIVDDWTPE
jgi:hypothetical protein